jgi:glycosyltransferase involved in cell wall biosynthesis
MRVALVHGYFLHDSGSGVYVRELARALVRLGHELTLVCQEREPQRYDFIDRAYVLDEDNSGLRLIHSVARSYSGSCRLVRPHLGGKLLVYVEGAFPGFSRKDVTAFQSANADARDRYVDSNVLALRRVFAEWPPELVLSQHLIMQPFVVRTALEGTAPYFVTEHGSALNFSVRRCKELVPFALDGLGDASAVVTVSPNARDDLVTWSGRHGLDIAEKTVWIPPGVDADLFAPAGDRRAAIESMLSRVELPPGFDVRPDDDVLVFAGALRATKGVQHAIASLPLIAHRRGKRVRLLIAGDGPARAPLEELSALTAGGDVAAARRLVARERELGSPEEWGEVVADAPPLLEGPSAAFLGHVDHTRLSSVFAAADVALAPSVFPEAAALVSSEALSAGALPLAAYHSGMVALADVLADALHDTSFTSLISGHNLTRRIADSVVELLDRYPTTDPGFRQRVREIASNRYPTWEGTADSYLRMAPLRQ